MNEIINEFIKVDILLVEDTTSDAEMTIRALRKRGLANNLVWVKDGREALDFLFFMGEFSNRDKTQPKLILLDLKMPKIDGLEVLRQIKKVDATKTIPVVMLTSSAEERDIVDSYELGINSFIVKPVDTDQFDQVVSDAGLYWTLVNKMIVR